MNARELRTQINNLKQTLHQACERHFSSGIYSTIHPFELFLHLEKRLQGNLTDFQDRSVLTFFFSEELKWVEKFFEKDSDPDESNPLFQYCLQQGVTREQI